MDLARSEVRQTLKLDRPTRAKRDGRNLIPLETGLQPEGIDPELAAMIHWAPFVLIGEPTMPI
jgi:hypothetical protein